MRSDIGLLKKPCSYDINNEYIFSMWIIRIKFMKIIWLYFTQQIIGNLVLCRFYELPQALVYSRKHQIELIFVIRNNLFIPRKPFSIIISAECMFLDKVTLNLSFYFIYLFSLFSFLLINFTLIQPLFSTLWHVLF